VETEKKKTDWMQLISFVLIVILTLEVILLILQNRELKKQLTEITTRKAPPLLKAGDIVNDFTAVALDGTTERISYGDPSKKYLFFIFSTTCPFCVKTLDKWNEIAKNNRNSDCIITGISTHDLERTKKYVSEKNPSFTVLSADTSFQRSYKIFGVPQTTLIKGNGTVEKSWNGALTDQQVNEVDSLLNTSKALRN
jgi:peroxiredoxin